VQDLIVCLLLRHGFTQVINTSYIGSLAAAVISFFSFPPVVYLLIVKQDGFLVARQRH